MDDLIDHNGPLATCFAPAERADAETLERQRSAVMGNELTLALLQAMPGYAMLINQQRQIVAVNANVLRITGAGSVDQLIGKRPGEALNCVHSEEAPGGCGTGQHCSVCGAVLAIVNSQESDAQAVCECHVTLSGAEGAVLDMQATATPVVVHGEKLTVFVLHDISNEKRKDVLERIFFHDVSNTAGCIHGLASLLTEHDSLPKHLESEYKSWLVRLSDSLLDEIRSQRKLLAAEKGEFEPELSTFALGTIVAEVYRLYRDYEKTPGRTLRVADGPDCVVTSDAAVLRRIIGSMTLNALEASPMGGVVTISVRTVGDTAVVEVHNPGEMPEEVRLKLFKRSFSTKSSAGRGIGTYSMKLFGERYLGGKVSFTSGSEGTVFSFSLPLGASDE